LLIMWSGMKVSLRKYSRGPDSASRDWLVNHKTLDRFCAIAESQKCLNNTTPIEEAGEDRPKMTPPKNKKMSKTKYPSTWSPRSPSKRIFAKCRGSWSRWRTEKHMPTSRITRLLLHFYERIQDVHEHETVVQSITSSNSYLSK
jgi:hypothetical protein